MSVHGRAWLADLVRALDVLGGDDALERAAPLLGLRAPAREPKPGPKPEREPAPPGRRFDEQGDGGGPGPVREEVSTTRPSLSPTFQWAVTRAESARPSSDEVAAAPLPAAPPGPARRASVDRAAQPLVPHARLEPLLESLLAERRVSRQVDERGLAERWAHGEVMNRVPRVVRRTRPRHVHVLSEQGPPTWSFTEDHIAVHARLRRVLGARAVTFQPVWRVPERWAVQGADAVLALSSLGALAPAPALWGRAWARLGARLRDQGTRALALTFVRDARPAETWTCARWGRHVGVDRVSLRSARARRVLEALSVAYWFEPGLLRDLCRALGADAVTEADVAANVDTDTRSRLLGEVVATARPSLHAGFASWAPRDKATVVRVLRAWHDDGRWPPEVWAEEVLALVALGAPGLTESDVARARHTLAGWMRQLESPATAEDQKRALAEGLAGAQWRWAPGVGAHVPEARALWQHVRERVRRTGAVPGWVAPEDVLPPPAPGREAHAYALVLSASGHVRVGLAGEALGSSALGIIDAVEPAWVVSEAGSPSLRLVTPSDAVELPEADAVARPEWAEAAGRDEYGVWASVRVGAVVFRMRWIEPGTGMIGSPPGEVGRGSGEDQREITFDEGFWMAETPATQELWREVMGDGPSRFRGRTRPVERVSWDDVQRFLARLAERVPGLGAVLPTEEAWEYACRAGSRTATDGGDPGKGEDVASRVLDAIAWYWPNSGRETHPVATKAPNAWGLYDTLGNVWEWTSTEWGSSRVLRGGSWNDDARLVRAALRFAAHPASRASNDGFRLSRGQVRPVQAGPEGRVRAGPEGRPVRSPPLAHTPARARVSLRTDRTVLTLEALPRPAWATAFGRDRFGLWADDVIAGVRLRLRWIPPGRFLMGSPKDEPGHFGREAPRHEVLLTRGYWLAEVPCTQDLWTAVMGPQKNPSHFRSPRRPVDTVTWEEARAFAEDALAQRGHAGYRLPTEAQWEHACRAGSTEATYGGAMDILGAHNAPVLDAIAWYGGNSGVGWDLPAAQGEDSGGWPDKQHPHTRAGTREVAQKAPNAWGLYDMLGNIFEWCADGLRRYTAEPVEDPDHRVEMGSLRVLRGGSWFSAARLVRAAPRNAVPPVVGIAHYGFRLSRGQVRPEQEPEQRSQRSAVAGGASGANAGGTPRRPEDAHDVLTPALGLEHDTPNLASSAPTSRRAKPKKP